MSIDSTASAPEQRPPLAARLTCTVREACENTGLSTMTFYRAMYRGELMTKKRGRRRLIVVSSLLRFLDLDNQAAA